MSREVWNINTAEGQRILAKMQSIDPSEIKKFIVRGDKLKIKTESWRVLKLKWADLTDFQNRSNKKVSKDINVQQIVNVLVSQGIQQTPEQVIQTQEVNALKQLLERYRQLLERYEAEFGALKSDINTDPNTALWNRFTGNPQTYNDNNKGFFPSSFPSSNNAPVNTGNPIEKENPNAIPVNGGDGKKKLQYGAVDNISLSANETQPSVPKHKEKIPDDAIALNYQSIYELDTSLKDEDISKMSNRDIIKRLFRGEKDEFVDIIETKGKENETTAPSSAEKEFLRTFFKQPMNRLVTKRGGDPLEIWEEMEKVMRKNPSALEGMSNYKNNIDFWMKNPIFWDSTKFKSTSMLNRLFQSDPEMVAENLAKLSAMYVDVMSNKGKYAYTNRLFAMMDRAWGVDYEFAKGWLQKIIGANRDNVGQVRLSDGSHLLDTKRDLSEARKQLVALVGGDIPPYLSNSELTDKTLQDVLNRSVKGKLEPYTDGIVTSFNKYKGLKNSFDILAANSPDSGHMNAGLMLTEGKAFGATDAEIYNIRALVENGVLSTKYGSISDATRLMNFFADYNNNGKGGDAADYAKYSGAQLLWNFRMAVNKLQFNNGGMDKTAAETKIVSWLLNKISANALQGGKLYVANVIDTYLKNKPTDILSLVQDHPGIVKYIQEYLKNFSWDDLYPLMFVDEIKSFGTYNKEIEATAQNDVQNLASQLQKIEDPTERAKVEQAIKQRALALQEDIKAQSATLSPDEQKYFNSFDLASLEQNVAHTVFRALQVNPSFNGALGAGVAVDLVKNIQLNLSAATGKNGVTVPSLWLGFKSDSGVFGANVNATHLGANAAAFVRFGERSNTSKLSNTLKPLTYKTTTLTGNVSGGMWFDRVPHVGAGIQLQSTSDKLKGINIIANNIRNTTLWFLPSVLDDEWLRLINAITAESRVKWRTIVQSDNFISGPRTQFLDRVKAQLASKYGADKSDAPLLDKAANNILTAILQAEKQPGADLNNTVANYMAAQWRNDSLDNLTHTYELTSLWVGIGAFIDPTNLTWPVTIGAQLSAWLSRYNRGAGAVNSTESYEAFRNAEEYGVDNLDLKMDPQSFVSYLNGMIDVSRGMPEYKDGKVVRKFPEIKLSDDNQFIVIPAALYQKDKNLTLKIAPGAKVSKDNDGNILISRTEDMRMVGQADQNKAIYILNIWSSVTSDQDHVMRRWDVDFTKKNSDGKDVFVAPEQIQHRKKMKIEINEQSVQTLQSILGSDASGFRIENNNLVYTKWGQPQHVSINGGVVDGWTISVSSTWLNFTKKNPDWKSESQPINLDYVFSSFESVMKAIDDKASFIESWENKNPNAVKSFYSHAIGGNYDEALKALRWLDISAIKAVQGNSDPWYKQKLVAYMTEAFALEPGYGKQNAGQLMTLRDKGSSTPAYTRIPWFESGGISIGKLFDRNKLRDLYSSQVPSNKWDFQKDLIGYTAFYRKRTLKNGTEQHRGYAMTLPWYTRVLGNKTYEFSTEQEKKDAKIWLIAKIKEDTFARQAILDSLSSKNLAPISKESIANLSPDQLVTLLTSKDWLPIGDCTLSIDATPVFYLLSECANESLGLKLNAITCSQNGEIIKNVSTDMTEEFEDGKYGEAITNAWATRTLGKKTIFKVAFWAATTLNGGGGWNWYKEWDVNTNPWGNGHWDQTGWNPTTWNWWDGHWDQTGNQTWWG